MYRLPYLCTNTHTHSLMYSHCIIYYSYLNKFLNPKLLIPYRTNYHNHQTTTNYGINQDWQEPGVPEREKYQVMCTRGKRTTGWKPYLFDHDKTKHRIYSWFGTSKEHLTMAYFTRDKEKVR